MNGSWNTLGQVAGDASGALVGLLFVSVSLNRERIAKSEIGRALALQTLIIFMLPLVTAFLLLTPQSSRILGGEFVALGVIQAIALLWVGRGRRVTADVLPSRLARLVLRVTATRGTTVLMVASGAMLIAGCRDGLYLLVPAMIVAEVGGVWSAWLFLVPHARPES